MMYTQYSGYTLYSGYIFITIFIKYSYLADFHGLYCFTVRNLCTTLEFKVYVLKFIEVKPLLGKNRNKEKFFFTLLSFGFYIINIKKLFISDRLPKPFLSIFIFYLLYGYLSCLSLLLKCLLECMQVYVRELKNLVPFLLFTYPDMHKYATYKAEVFFWCHFLTTKF